MHHPCTIHHFIFLNLLLFIQNMKLMVQSSIGATEIRQSFDNTDICPPAFGGHGLLGVRIVAHCAVFRGILRLRCTRFAPFQMDFFGMVQHGNDSQANHNHR